MRHPETTRPFVFFFFLVLPYGISSGFVSITLPLVLTRAGFSVATAASTFWRRSAFVARQRAGRLQDRAGWLGA
jgi:hypothetical protein